MTAPTGLRRATGQVAVVTALARVVGFLRWFAFAWAVGSTGVGTIYQSVNAVPNLVYEIVAGGVLAAVVVPLVAAARRQGRGDEVASSLLTGAVALLTPVALLLVVLAPWVSARLLDGVPIDGAGGLGARLLVLFSPQVVLYGIGVVVAGTLQAHERLLAAAVAPLLSSVVVIATYLTYAAVVPSRGTGPAGIPDTGWWVLGAGTTLGVVALSLPLLLVAARSGIRLRPRWALTVDDRRRAAQLARAGLIGLLAQQVALLVILRVANRSGGDGAFVVHQYAQAVYLLPYAVLAVPVATATFARLAGREAGSDLDVQAESRATLNRSLRVVVALAGTATAALVAAAPGVGAFFAMIDRGSATGEGSRVVLDGLPPALATTSLGLVGFSVTALAMRALFVRGSSLHAGLAVAAGWVVAAGVPALLLGRGEGAVPTLRTIGTASALGMTLSAVLLVVALRPVWGSAVTGGLPRVLLGLLPALALAGAAGWWLGTLDLARGGTIALAVVLGAAAAATAGGVCLAADPSLRHALRRAR